MATPNPIDNKDNVFYENLGNYGQHAYWARVKRHAKKYFDKVELTNPSGKYGNSDNIRRLAQAEERKEAAVLSNFFQVDISSGELKGKDLIRAMNKVFNLPANYERALKIFTSDEKGLGKNQLSMGLFEQYARNAARIRMNNLAKNRTFLRALETENYAKVEEILAEALQKGIIDGLENTLKRPSSRGSKEHPWEPLVKVLREMQDLRSEFRVDFFQRLKLDDLVKEIMEYATGTTPENLMKEIRKQGDLLKTQGRVGADKANISALAAEYFGRIALEFNIKGMGSNAPKMTSIVTKSNASTPDSIYLLSLEAGTLKPLDYNSKTITDKKDAIRAAEETSNKLNDSIEKTAIVYENTKAYLINMKEGARTFRAFAGGERKLNNILPILNEMGYNNNGQAENFIRLVRQTSKEAIYGGDESKKQAASEELARAVSMFLFDDISAIGDSEKNSIHIFRLSDVVIPLSYFLYQVANAMDESVKVTFGGSTETLYKDADYAAGVYAKDSNGDDGTSAKRWKNQREDADTRTVAITFMKNFKALLKTLS